MSNGRLERLRARMAELKLEAMLITQPDNRRYITGFTGSTGTALVTASSALFITDFRYWEQVGQQCPDFTLVQQKKTFKEAFRQAVRASGAQNVGIETRDVSVGLFQDMCDALEQKSGPPLAELQPAADVIEPLRLIKDESEIASIARAAAITDQALAAALAVFTPGITETQASWEIERRMREAGASDVAFELIVASGPNAALPHARPSDRQLRLSEPIVIDIGAEVDGYRSDMTRTVCLGKQTPKFRRVYDVVLQAQEAALTAIKAGQLDRDMDALARKIISDAGFGSKFGHSLGHGVGLQVHEGPRLSHLLAEPKPLRPGMVVTVEPGIYLPGWGGVRIEDLVVVTETGIRDLTSAPK